MSLGGIQAVRLAKEGPWRSRRGPGSQPHAEGCTLNAVESAAWKIQRVSRASDDPKHLVTVAGSSNSICTRHVGGRRGQDYKVGYTPIFLAKRCVGTLAEEKLHSLELAH